MEWDRLCLGPCKCISYIDVLQQTLFWVRTGTCNCNPSSDSVFCQNNHRGIHLIDFHPTCLKKKIRKLPRKEKKNKKTTKFRKSGTEHMAEKQQKWSKKNNKKLDHKELDNKHAATFSSYTNSHTVLDDTLAEEVQAWKDKIVL